MQAGVVGWNAIRVYNPTKQLTDWDSECRFVKQWVPELQDTTPEHIINAKSVSGYPGPVVPFTERAKWMASQLYAIRNSPEANTGLIRFDASMTPPEAAPAPIIV